MTIDHNAAELLQDVCFIESDRRRFPQTSRRGYAQFDYNASSGPFAPKAGVRSPMSEPMNA
jgi:hypothetical protein